LILENTSANPDAPGYNFSWSATGPESGGGKAFTRLLVTSTIAESAREPALRILPLQDESWRASGNLTSEDLAVLKAAPVLMARARARGVGRANLNLSGTPMHLGPDVMFGLSGNSNGYRYRVSVTDDRKNLDLVLEPIAGQDANTEAVVTPIGPILLVHD
jgi:hypothetical protein